MKKAVTRTAITNKPQKSAVIVAINQIRNKVNNKKKKWNSVKLLRQIRNDQ